MSNDTSSPRWQFSILDALVILTLVAAFFGMVRAYPHWIARLPMAISILLLPALLAVSVFYGSVNMRCFGVAGLTVNIVFVLFVMPHQRFDLINFSEIFPMQGGYTSHPDYVLVWTCYMLMPIGGGLIGIGWRRFLLRAKLHR